ncbi:MAG TPA: nucleotide exchange factor GrpE [Bacteriovoracaceae bacterium]|nr:nucleotide exchange factor GrpE [Bacteriovoracaceae bacterium]
MENQENKEKTQAEEQKNETAQVEAENAETEAKKDEVDYKEKYFYLAAEHDNYRKRMEREKESIIKFGNEKVLSDLLEVIDTLERTIDMLRPDEDQKVKNLVVGLDMVNKLFLDKLDRHGLTQVESLGKDFDPNFHEAMAQEYVEGKKPNEVVKEYQKGYVLNGRLLRAAKVVVASDKQ